MKAYLEQEGKCGNQPHANILFAWQKFFTKKDPSIQKGREEEESQSTSKEEVQGESNCMALAGQPNFACKPYLPHWPHPNSG